MPSNVKAIEAARARRVTKAEAKVTWSVDKFLQGVNLTLKQRMSLAVAYLQSKVVINISVPVVKQVRVGEMKSYLDAQANIKNRREKRTVVTERSKKGEFPRADTTQLMKSIFSGVVPDGKGGWMGFVGTPLDYGLILELSDDMDRRYLFRTFVQELPMLKKILGGDASGQVSAQAGAPPPAGTPGQTGSPPTAGGTL